MALGWALSATLMACAMVRGGVKAVSRATPIKSARHPLGQPLGQASWPASWLASWPRLLAKLLAGLLAKPLGQASWPSLLAKSLGQVSWPSLLAKPLASAWPHGQLLGQASSPASCHDLCLLRACLPAWRAATPKRKTAAQVLIC